MQTASLSKLLSILTFMIGLLILKVTLSVMLGYRDYFPPNFDSDFLHGRQSYFYSGYQWAFYLHIVSGPLSLFFGLILLSERLRRRFPRWHRSIGKVQIAIVLLLVAPSGLWMAFYAQTGLVAAVGFSLLAIHTALCAWFGWQSAMKKRFAEHRRWMLRTFLLLCSAVVIRLIGGLATVMEVGVTWIYPLAAWASWLVPLAIFEVSRIINSRLGKSRKLSESHSTHVAASWSLPAAEMIARR